jgi:hypothetical protein
LWCIPQVDAEYVARMEDVLDLYAEPPDPGRVHGQRIAALKQDVFAVPGMQAGFSDISHFNRHFRSCFGVTPATCRAEVHKISIQEVKRTRKPATTVAQAKEAMPISIYRFGAIRKRLSGSPRSLGPPDRVIAAWWATWRPRAPLGALNYALC